MCLKLSLQIIKPIEFLNFKLINVIKYIICDFILMPSISANLLTHFLVDRSISWSLLINISEVYTEV